MNLSFHEQMSADNLKKKCHFSYKTEKCERKKQMIAELVPVSSRKFGATDYSFITV